MAKQVRPRKREPGSHLSFEDVSQIRTFPADSIGASRLIILHQRPDIRQQPDLNMPDIKIILHTWRQCDVKSRKLFFFFRLFSLEKENLVFVHQCPYGTCAQAVMLACEAAIKVPTGHRRPSRKVKLTLPVRGGKGRGQGRQGQRR